MPESHQSRVVDRSTRDPCCAVVRQFGEAPRSRTGVEATAGESVGALDGSMADVRNDSTGSPIVMDAIGPLAQSEFGPAKIEAGERCLVLGEIRTSEQDIQPPSVMRVQSGLLQQLKDLRTDGALQHFLIRNLFFRCTGHLRERFIAAARRHTADPDDCRFFGVLVRDVLPDKRDLRHAVSRLGHDCPELTRIEVLAIYLPPGHLDSVASDSTFDGGTP